LGTKPPGKPNWGSQLALTELSIPNPLIMNWFSKWKKPRYSEAVKPFNRFVHVALKETHLSPEERVTLVSPYTASRVNNPWFANIHDPEGKRFRVIAKRSTYPDSETLFGETYDDLISQHGMSKEAKFLTALGDKVTGRTRGLLAQQAIQVTNILHVGKEANEFDLVRAGLIRDEEEVLTVYKRDLWEEMKPIVMKMPVEEIMRMFGYSRRMAYAIKAGERRPARKVIGLLANILRLGDSLQE